MNQNHLHELIKLIGIQSAELMECIQWSETDIDLSKARIVAMNLSSQVERLLEELK